MASYNHEKYISKAIESILSQTFADFELVIIDDASTDMSKEIIKSYEKKDKRIRTIFHLQNKGIPKTANQSVEMAHGKFIAFSSSDDLWVKDKLERQLEVLKKDENLVVYSEGSVIDARGSPTGRTFTYGAGALKRTKSGYIFKELLKGDFICAPSIILKEENIKGIRFCEQLKYMNDYKFKIDLARRFEFYFISEPLVMYRVHGRNATVSDELEWAKDRIIIGKLLLQEYGNEMSNGEKGNLYSRISIGCSLIDEKSDAKKYAYNAIKIKPFNRANLLPIVLVFTGTEGLIYSYLKRCYQMRKPSIWR